MWMLDGRESRRVIITTWLGRFWRFATAVLGTFFVVITAFISSIIIDLLVRHVISNLLDHTGPQMSSKPFIQVMLPSDGAFAAFVVVVVGALAARRHRLITSLVIFLFGAYFAWLLVGTWYPSATWPDRFLPAGPPRVWSPIVCTWIGGLFGVLVVALREWKTVVERGKLKWIIPVALSFVLNAGLVFCGRGKTFAAILPIAISLSMALFLLISTLVFRKFRDFCAQDIALACVVFSTLLSIPAGILVHAGDLHKAQSFCETLIPGIERIKAQTGAYPSDVSSVLAEQHPPRLFQSCVYRLDGTNFSLVVIDPSLIMNDGMKYSSQTKAWCHY